MLYINNTYNDISPQIIFVLFLLEKRTTDISLLSPSTESYQTDISVCRPDCNFNQYLSVRFGVGYSKNHSALLNNVNTRK